MNHVFYGFVPQLPHVSLGLPQMSLQYITVHLCTRVSLLRLIVIFFIVLRIPSTIFIISTTYTYTICIPGFIILCIIL